MAYANRSPQIKGWLWKTLWDSTKQHLILVWLVSGFTCTWQRNSSRLNHEIQATQSRKCVGDLWVYMPLMLNCNFSFFLFIWATWSSPLLTKDIIQLLPKNSQGFSWNQSWFSSLRHCGNHMSFSPGDFAGCLLSCQSEAAHNFNYEYRKKGRSLCHVPSITPLPDRSLEKFSVSVSALCTETARSDLTKQQVDVSRQGRLKDNFTTLECLRSGWRGLGGIRVSGICHLPWQGGGTRWTLRSFSTWTILWFHIFCNILNFLHLISFLQYFLPHETVQNSLENSIVLSPTCCYLWIYCLNCSYREINYF